VSREILPTSRNLAGESGTVYGNSPRRRCPCHSVRKRNHDSKLSLSLVAWGLKIAREYHLSPSQLALLAGLLQLAVALGVYLRPSPCEHVVRRHVANGAVQADVVIAIYILLDQAFCVF
jgi:hypothetical protein